MTDEVYTMPCGCEFPIVGKSPYPDDPLPLLDVDVEDPPDCPLVWDMLAKGLTTGVFQLESFLGQTWSRKLKPRTLEHMNALVALLRPGCLDARDNDGVSMTERYARRANGEPVPSVHPAVDPVVAATYGIFCIHEDARVALADGRTEAMKHLRPGLQIWSYDERRKLMSVGVCENSGYTRTCDGLRITLRNGFSVTVTRDHEIYTPAGFVLAESLAVDDLVGVPTRLPSDGVDDVGDDAPTATATSLAYLCGQFIGDGNLPKTGQANIAVGPREKADVLADWIRSNIDGVVCRIYFHTRCWYVSVSGSRLKNLPHPYNRTTEFSGWLTSSGVRGNCYTKEIPPWVALGSESTKAAFLAGLLDADGYSAKSGSMSCVTYCSASPGIREGVRHLCQSLGVAVTVGGDGRHVRAIGTKRFWELVGPFTLFKKPVGRISEAGLYYCAPRSVIPTGLTQTHIHRKIGIQRATQIRNRPWISSKSAKRVGYEVGDVGFVPVKSVEVVPDQVFYGVNVGPYQNLVADGVLVHNCFQEQLMQCSSIVAKFDSNKQDELRKGVGKKQMDVIARVGRDFVKGVEEHGVVPVEVGQTLWDIFKASGRYLFNKSHSMAYGTIGYHTAYSKAHFPLQFYTAWLKHAREKNFKWHEEVEKITTEAKIFDLKVNRPKFTDLEPHTWTDGREIHLGICDVKGVGVKTGKKDIEDMKKLLESLGDPQPLAEWSWYKILTHLPVAVGTGVVRKLIEVGAFPQDKEIPRRRKLAEWEDVVKLEAGELRWLQQRMKELGYPPIHTVMAEIPHEVFEAAKKRKRKTAKPKADRETTVRGQARLLASPPSPLVDSPYLIANWERNALGVALTCTRVDGCDTTDVTHSCVDVLAGVNLGGRIQVGVEVKRFKEMETRKGKNAGKMNCYLTVSDSTGDLEVKVWSDVYAEYRNLIRERNLLLISGRWDKKFSSFVAEKIFQLS